MSLNFPVSFSLFYRIPLLVLFLPLCEPYLKLCLAGLEVEFQRYQGQALLVDIAQELIYLFSVKQQLSCPHRVMVLKVPVAVRAYMATEEKGLVVLDDHIAFLEVRLAISQRLYFRSNERYSGLIGILYMIIMVRLPVFSYDFYHLKRITLLLSQVNAGLDISYYLIDQLISVINYGEGLHRKNEIQKNNRGNHGNTESKFNYKAAQFKSRFIQEFNFQK